MPPLVVRMPTWYWVNHLVLAGLGVFNGLVRARWMLFFVPLWLFAAWTGRRMGTVADDEGLRVHSGLRERRVAWSEVFELSHRLTGTLAVLRDGKKVGLPAVTKRAIVPEAHVHPRSAQAVALRAKAAGYEVPVEGRTV